MPTDHYCEACGAAVPAGAERCPQCGAAQHGAALRPRAAAVPLGAPAVRQRRGFVGALFDFRFEVLVTTRIVRVLYVLAVVVIALGYLVGTIAAFVGSPGRGIGALIGGGVVAAFWLVLARVALESVVTRFVLAENSSRILALLEQDRAER